MPFYYDLSRATTTNGTTLTESSHLWGQTVANQQVAAIAGVFITARSATAGGGTMRVKTNSGAAAPGGTTQTPQPRNNLWAAAQSGWKNDATAITPGGTLLTRLSVGFAQAGGMGGWVGMEPENRIQLQPNGASPVDVEFVSLAVATSVPFDLTVDLAEGTG